MIERWIKRNHNETYEKVFGVTSLNSNHEKIFSLLRGHWSIENRSHGYWALVEVLGSWCYFSRR